MWTPFGSAHHLGSKGFPSGYTNGFADQRNGVQYRWVFNGEGGWAAHVVVDGQRVR